MLQGANPPPSAEREGYPVAVHPRDTYEGPVFPLTPRATYLTRTKITTPRPTQTTDIITPEKLT